MLTLGCNVQHRSFFLQFWVWFLTVCKAVPFSPPPPVTALISFCSIYFSLSIAFWVASCWKQPVGQAVAWLPRAVCHLHHLSCKSFLLAVLQETLFFCMTPQNRLSFSVCHVNHSIFSPKTAQPRYLLSNSEAFINGILERAWILMIQHVGRCLVSLLSFYLYEVPLVLFFFNLLTHLLCLLYSRSNTNHFLQQTNNALNL